MLNHADNYPGGEAPSNASDIAARCRDAGRSRFAWAAFTGTAGIVLAAAVAIGFRRRTG
ncbi:MAG: hypothetical protein QM572_09140 [Nocardioides sp.]|uniref:hypothetical protein n=1 Tax=Nocardioides sp. TaxID=35761 RepID=UPI0039E6AB76